MGRYVAFLAGINVGRRRIKMDALQGQFLDMKFTDVMTILATGNVIFSTTLRSATACATRIENELAEQLGYRVNTYIRTPAEVQAVIDESPFPIAATNSKSSIQVLFLNEVLSAQQSKALQAIRSETDQFASRGRELYWKVDGRISDSKIWLSPEMKAIQLPSITARNMNSVCKVAKALSKF